MTMLQVDTHTSEKLKKIFEKVGGRRKKSKMAVWYFQKKIIIKKNKF